MPKTRISRSTIYARWMKANDAVMAAVHSDSQKAAYRAYMRVAATSFALAEFERDATFRASWRKMARQSIKNASYYA